jgi:hypothetical protein
MAVQLHSPRSILACVVTRSTGMWPAAALTAMYHKPPDTVGEVVSQVAKREVRVGASGRWANHAPSRSRLIAAAVARLCRPILASPR